MSDFWNEIDADDGEGPDNDGWIQNSLERASREPRPQTTREMMIEDLKMGRRKIAADDNTCRNCDKPTSGEYCSNTCEDSDKHPAPRDDQEKFTSTSRKTAARDLESVARAFASYWGGEFQGIDRSPVSLIDGLWDGPWATVKNEYGEWAKIKDISGEDSGQIENHRPNPDFVEGPDAYSYPYKGGQPPYIYDKVMRPAGTYAVVYYDREVMHINTKGGQLVLEGYSGDIPLTSIGSKTASDLENSWQTDFDANAAYWSGAARAAEQQKSAEQRLRDMRGKEITVTRGRKIPHGTTGVVFYSGEGQWGWRIGFKTADGSELWIDAHNVELTSELSSTSSRKVAAPRRQEPQSHSGLIPGKWYVTDRAGDLSGGPYDTVDKANMLRSLGPEFARIYQADDNGSFVAGGTDPSTKVWYASKEATRKTAGPMGINVGDVFYNSWGYDQTNVDFYEVVRCTEKMVEVKPIQSRVVDSGAYNQSVEPVRGSYRDFDVIIDTGRSSPYGKPERSTKMCRVGPGYQGRPTITLNDSHSAWAYEGKPLHESGPYGGH